MNTIVTKCAGCVFASYGRDGFQHGCHLDRSSKLEIHELSESEKNFVLKRFCNTYRSQEWVDNLDFDEAIDTVKTVLDEVYPRIGIFVKFNTEEENAIQSLEKTINSIDEIENGPVSYVVVINDKVEYNEEIWGLFLNTFGEKSDTKYHILQSKNISKEIDAAFMHAQNGWIFNTSSGFTVPKDVLKRLNNLLNVEMKQIVMVEPYDKENGLMFPAYLFKFLNGNNPKMFSDNEFDDNDFVTKVKNADKRGNTKSIWTWEEFNAS